MIPKIENRTYSYQGDNVCSISATLNIYLDDGTTIVASTGLSAIGNVLNGTFKDDITASIVQQVLAYMNKLNELETMRMSVFPGSTDFNSAIDQIFDPIQIGIGG